MAAVRRFSGSKIRTLAALDGLADKSLSKPGPPVLGAYGAGPQRRLERDITVKVDPVHDLTGAARQIRPPR